VSSWPEIVGQLVEIGLKCSRRECSLAVDFLEGVLMSFQEALDTLSRDDRFKATIYAMNSLLIQKGVYSRAEFEKLFSEWAEKQREGKLAGASQSTHPAHP
jgi:hypothetical protein